MDTKSNNEKTEQINVETTQNVVVANGDVPEENGQQNGLDIEQKDYVVQQIEEVSKHFENDSQQNVDDTELDLSDLQQNENFTQQTNVVDKPSYDENVEIDLTLTSNNAENNVEIEENIEPENLVDGIDKLDLSQDKNIPEQDDICVENGESSVIEEQAFQPVVNSEKDKALYTHENNIDNNGSLEDQQHQKDDKALSKPADDEKLILELNNIDSGVNTSVEDSPHVNSAVGDNDITMKSDSENKAENELSVQIAPASSVQEPGLLTVAPNGQHEDSEKKNADLNTPVMNQNPVKSDHVEPRQTRVKNVRPQRQMSSSSDDEQPYVNHRTSLNLSLDEEEPYYNQPSPLTVPSTKPKLVADSSFDMNVVNVKISHKRQGSNVSVASLTERCREIKGEAIEHNTTPKKSPISAHDDSLEAHLQPHHEPLTVEHHHSADESDEDGKLYPVSPFPPPQTTTQSIYSQRSVSLSELSFERTQELGDEDEKLLEDMMEYDRIDVQNDLIESIDSITDVEDNDSPPPVDINDPDSKGENNVFLEFEMLSKKRFWRLLDPVEIPCIFPL